MVPNRATHHNYVLRVKYILFTFSFCLCCAEFSHKDGHIEFNSGPSKKSTSSFLGCHWNVSSLMNVFSLKTYNNIHKYEFICISETYLNS